MESTENLNKTPFWKTQRFKIAFFSVSLLFIGILYYFYSILYSSNITKECYVTILPNSTFEQVKESLKITGCLNSESSFDQVANWLKYPKLIKSGKYRLKQGLNNLALVRKLRAGDQDAVKIRFESGRTLNDILLDLDPQLALSKDDLEKLLKDESFISKLGFNSQTIISMFIPNTYEMYWDIKAEDFLKKMKSNYDQFWTPDKKQKAELQKLNPIEVSVLASIVEAESYQIKERPTIAGVYLNRLRAGERLQADPTVIFAIGDFSIKRLSHAQLKFDSPYNTYQNKGLPPGPINAPSVTALDAVLNPETHNYKFFCAKADLSGFHSFAVNYNDHLKFAREYQRALDNLNVKK